MSTPTRPLEAKVLIPAVVGVVAAVLALLAAFGLRLDPEQERAILGVATAVVPLVMALLGYLAPHTPRPDLAAKGDPTAGPEDAPLPADLYAPDEPNQEDLP